MAASRRGSRASGLSGVRRGDDYMKNYFVSRCGAIEGIDFAPVFEGLTEVGGDGEWVVDRRIAIERVLIGAGTIKRVTGPSSRASERPYIKKCFTWGKV